MQITLEQRIAHLEKMNRRFMAALLVLGVCALGGILMGAAPPSPKTISAEKFILVDGAGKQLALLSSNENSAALQFLNRDGSRALTLTAGIAGNGLIIADGKGNRRTSLIASDDGKSYFAMTKPDTYKDSVVLVDSPDATGVAFRDANGKDRLNIGFTVKGAGVLLSDANETERAMMSEQGVITWAKGGQIDWASIGEKLTPAERKRVVDIVNSGTAQ